jgi:ADP-ribose pyrophosphatase YjhB (NUDIX family)
MSEIALAWMLVEQDGTVLLAHRKSNRPPFPDLWVLPGDVMKEDESASETLSRVAHDELDTYVRSDDFVATLNFSIAGDEYAANVFRVALGGHPRYRESGDYTQVAWAANDAPPDPIPDALRDLLAGKLPETSAGEA